MSATPKCPICGGRITYSSDSFRILRGGCLPCGWQTLNGWYTVVNRDKAVLDFISQFPPFMRVYPGDKIRYDAGDEEFDGIVVGIERDEHNDRHLLVESMCYSGTDRVYSYQIIKWPWELEGGEA